MNSLLFSTINLIIPNAALLKAKGSLELEGFNFIPKNPTKVSNLSVRDKAKLKGFLGVLLSSPFGK